MKKLTILSSLLCVALFLSAQSSYTEAIRKRGEGLLHKPIIFDIFGA